MKKSSVKKSIKKSKKVLEQKLKNGQAKILYKKDFVREQSNINNELITK